MSDERKAQEREYKAIVWTNQPDTVGIRVSLRATSLDEAEEFIKKEYGADCTFTLWNENDASTAR